MCMIKNKILFTKRFKTSIKSQISCGKGTYRVIKFNQKAWLKPYTTMNTELRKKQRMKEAKDVETRSDTSNYELDRPLPKGNNKKLVCLMKN